MKPACPDSGIAQLIYFVAMWHRSSATGTPTTLFDVPSNMDFYHFLSIFDVGGIRSSEERLTGSVDQPLKTYAFECFILEESKFVNAQANIIGNFSY